MNLHEYQAKALIREYGVPVPQGRVVERPEQLPALMSELSEELGSAPKGWVLKAQIHAGGRGKAGGVRRVGSVSEAQAVATELLGRRLATHQTDAVGLPVERLLLEPASAIAEELYLGVLIDRSRERVLFMASRAGGVDIEQVAAERPEQILSLRVDPVAGLQPYQIRRVAFALGLKGEAVKQLVTAMQGLYRLFIERDASLVECNPLVITEEGTLLAVDAKVTIDSNALYRQKGLAAQCDHQQEDATERAAAEHGLNYITLDGTIACMVNGAGLAMATMDLIKLHGGEPANFLDVGGGTTAERVAEAFKLILADPNVEAILVNIFGGIVRCDLIAQGIIQAVQQAQVSVPVVVRLEGTRAEEGRALLAESELALIPAADLNDAANKVVAAAQRRREGP